MKPYVFCIISVLFSISSCEEDESYKECNSPFNCGNLQNLYYPFWSSNRSATCGQQGFKLTCIEAQLPIISIQKQKFRVVSVNQSVNSMTIAREDYWENLCPQNYTNTTLNKNLFYFPQTYPNISFFYKCRVLSPQMENIFPCSYWNAFYATDEKLRQWGLERPQCEQRVNVPIPSDGLLEIWYGVDALKEVLRRGFDVSYEYHENCWGCHDSGGICGSNSTTFKFICLCRNKPYSSLCPVENGTAAGNGLAGESKSIIGISSFLGGSGILLIICVIIYFSKNISLWKIKTNNQIFEAFLESYGPLPVKRYNFSQIKKMANSFNHKLGQGGYGTVFKGNLLDTDRPVAVKILNISKGEGEEFINEVASISRTSHVNVVTLLGFCLEGDKKVLVYEFMPNGSLDKFICHEIHNQHLEWKIMHEIAIGIARGLEYLHRGCNTRIVHFDIKPHNILLDENFCPKISDFGLAKLCTNKESIISIIEARGTIGYIAPEVFSRNFGKVSYKSDVYSYGMMVLEMIGGKTKDVTNETDRTSETYFPNWIYRCLELSNICELYKGVSLEEGDIVRKLAMVGLWCIQTNPSDRPSMSSVLEMLHGSTEALEFPPKPFLSSPPRSPPSCLYTTSTSIGE